MSSFRLINADVIAGLRQLPDESVNCCVTSPPYFGLRDYGMSGQIGLEATPAEYIARMVEVFQEVRRVLLPTSTLWLNIGDSYNAHPGQRKISDAAGDKQTSNNGSVGAPSRNVKELKPKDLIGIPWMLAFALRDAGWWLRSDIIWAKPNPMPESVTDRPTSSHEYLFLLSKSKNYEYDSDAIKEDGRHDGLNDRWDSMSKEEQCSLRRNKRSVWTIATQPYPEAHFAVMPEALVVPCVKAGCRKGGVVIDPFSGSGTVGVVALRHGCDYIGIELNPAYVTMARARLSNIEPMFHSEAVA